MFRDGEREGKGQWGSGKANFLQFPINHRKQNGKVSAENYIKSPIEAHSAGDSPLPSPLSPIHDQQRRNSCRVENKINNNESQKAEGELESEYFMGK